MVLWSCLKWSILDLANWKYIRMKYHLKKPCWINLCRESLQLHCTNVVWIDPLLKSIAYWIHCWHFITYCSLLNDSFTSFSCAIFFLGPLCEWLGACWSRGWWSEKQISSVDGSNKGEHWLKLGRQRSSQQSVCWALEDILELWIDQIKL